uniref:hypothetical protein n=1 Tax=Enterobacter hormaechei TaxID=158836 RepID=UPI0013C2A315
LIVVVMLVEEMNSTGMKIVAEEIHTVVVVVAVAVAVAVVLLLEEQPFSDLICFGIPTNVVDDGF